MHELGLTDHAEARMQQRGFRKKDLDFVFRIATQIADDAFFLTDRDVAREIERRRREIQQLERLRGSKLIVEGGALITLYHARPKHGRPCGKKGRK